MLSNKIISFMSLFRFVLVKVGNGTTHKKSSTPSALGQMFLITIQPNREYGLLNII